MAAAKAKTEPGYTRPQQGGPVDARPPRPLLGKIDYDAHITAAMKKFTKTRARLAE